MTSSSWRLAAGLASPAHVQGAAFGMAQALVILTVASFWVAAWGVFKATAWWEAFPGLLPVLSP